MQVCLNRKVPGIIAASYVRLKENTKSNFLSLGKRGQHGSPILQNVHEVIRIFILSIRTHASRDIFSAATIQQTALLLNPAGFVYVSPVPLFVAVT